MTDTKHSQYVDPDAVPRRLTAADFYTPNERKLYTFVDPDADPGPDIKVRMLRSCSVRLSRATRELEHVDEGSEVRIPFAWGMALVRDGSAVLVSVDSPVRVVR